MRICHVIDYFHTDVGYQEFFLARDQARAGHDVTVVSTHLRQHTVARPGPDEQMGLDELRDSGVRLIRLDARQLGHDRAWVRGLRHVVRGLDLDAVHVHGPFAPTTVRAVRAVRAASSGNATILVDNHIHEDIAPGSTSGLNRRVYRAFRLAAGPYLRRRVDTWVANGPHERDFLASRMGLPVAAVRTVPLGFDPDVFGWDPSRRLRGRAAVGAENTDTVIAITGKIHPRKRPETVAAAAELECRDRSIRLVLAGTVDAESRGRIDAAAPTLAASGRIIDLGSLGRSDLSDLYHASDAVVFARLPSISIYEAAGTGTRVLVGEDDFSDWLHGLCPSVEPIDIDPIDLSSIVPSVDEDRAERAAAATTPFAWPSIAGHFVDLYAAPRSGRLVG